MLTDWGALNLRQSAANKDNSSILSPSAFLGMSSCKRDSNGKKIHWGTQQTLFL
jgi:hypothetical protein